MNYSYIDPQTNETLLTLSTKYVPRVWPLWVEITVPLICIALFVLTLVVIYLRPSKPGDKPLFYIPIGRSRRNKPTVVFVVDENDVAVETGALNGNNDN